MARPFATGTLATLLLLMPLGDLRAEETFVFEPTALAIAGPDGLRLVERRFHWSANFATDTWGLIFSASVLAGPIEDARRVFEIGLGTQEHFKSVCGESMFWYRLPPPPVAPTNQPGAQASGQGLAPGLTLRFDASANASTRALTSSEVRDILRMMHSAALGTTPAKLPPECGGPLAAQQTPTADPP